MGCPARLTALAVLAVQAAVAVSAAAAPASGAGADPGVLENDASPALSGNVAVGGSVVASPGVWSGEGPISFAYQWLDCNSSSAVAPPVEQVQASLSGQLPADRQGMVLVASGSSRIRELGPAVVQIRTTVGGRRLVKRSRALQLIALATLVPTESPAVSALAAFTLA